MVSKILQGESFKSVLEEITLGEFFFNYASKYENNICQVDADQNISETYFSVKQRSVRLAIQLRNLGITSGDVVAICSQNNLDTVVALIATVYLGARVANLDSTSSARSTKHLLLLIRPKVIFVEDSALSLILSSTSDVDFKTEIVVLGKCEQFIQFSDVMAKADPDENNFRPVKVDVQETAILFFSSGTTGLPKAISHSHFSFLKLTEVVAKSHMTDYVTLHFTTFYWVSGMWILTSLFLSGGTRVFSRQMDGENTLRTIEQYKVTGIFMAPIQTYQLTGVKEPEKYDTSSLRIFVTGGTPINPFQLNRIQEIFNKAKISFAYGLTEIGAVSKCTLGEHGHVFKKSACCGKVLPLVNFKVVNQDTEEILGRNQDGEIRVKSPALMQGYYNQQSLSCFDSDGFLKTGDCGRIDEQECVYFIERLKEMFKYESWHIVPSSIEAILHEHPAVEESIVFGIPHGEQGELPAACVVLKKNVQVTKDEIQLFVDERASDREKLRGGLTFVDSLPRTCTGKIIRAEVRNIVVPRI